MNACKCGCDVVRAEVRVIHRCSNGHYVASHVAPAVVPVGAAVAAPEPVNSRQIVAFHARCENLDRATGVPAGTSKRAALARAGVESTKQLTYDQASELLSELQEQLEQAAR